MRKGQPLLLLYRDVTWRKMRRWLGAMAGGNGWGQWLGAMAGGDGWGAVKLGRVCIPGHPCSRLAIVVANGLGIFRQQDYNDK